MNILFGLDLRTIKKVKMRKIKLVFLAIFYCLLNSIEINAQNNISITMGLNRSNLVWTNLQEIGWKYKSDYFVGLRNA
jgi:hypothetical protein